MSPKDQLALSQNLPHPDATTSTQINSLLSIAGTLMGVLLNPLRDMEKIPGASDPSGNVLDSAEATFINVCNRLDSIITDPARFSMKFQHDMEHRAELIQNHNIELLKHQSAAAQEVVSPHFRFRPILQKTSDGTGWVAFLGDVTGSPENTIAGMGTSPAEAIIAFDQVFQGELPIKMLEWLAQREQALNAGIPFPTSPNTNKNETKYRSVDGRRNRKARRPSRGGSNQQSDSGNPS